MLGALVLTGLSAAAYAATFPPLGLAPLAWVALVPFLAAVVRVPPRRAAVLGAWWFVVVGIGVAWWLPRMISGYFELPAVVGWGGLLVVALGLGSTYSGLFAAWLSWAARRRPAGPLLVAASWGVYELARARLLIGNPWALTAYSQVRFTRLSQLADATGPYGVGMLVAAVNAVLASLLVRELRGRRPVVSAAIVALAVAGTWIYGGWRLEQTFATGEPVRVAVVQGAIERGFRWRPEYAHLGVDRYLALTRDAAPARPQLVVWPETAVSFYLQEATPQRDAVLTGTRDLGVDLILGGPHYAFEQAHTVYHNSVFVVHDGRVAGRYDKMHLLPLAEEGVPGRLLHRETSFSPGNATGVLAASGAHVGSFLCWEAMYPELVRRFALAGADLLVNLSNDAWFGETAPARHHLDIASVRAIENRRYLVRATATGFSAVVDPYGRIVARSGFGTTDVLTHPVWLSRVETPYQRLGDAVAWLAVAAVVAASIRRLAGAHT